MAQSPNPAKLGPRPACEAEMKALKAGEARCKGGSASQRMGPPPRAPLLSPFFMSLLGCSWLQLPPVPPNLFTFLMSLWAAQLLLVVAGAYSKFFHIFSCALLHDCMFHSHRRSPAPVLSNKHGIVCKLSGHFCQKGSSFSINHYQAN